MLMTGPLSHAQPFVPDCSRFDRVTAAFSNRSQGNRQPRLFFVFELLQSSRTQRVAAYSPLREFNNLLSH